MAITPLTAVLNWAEPENSRAKGEKKTSINAIISKINDIITGLEAQNELGELTDVTITSVADKEILAYDNGSSEWINQTATEAGLEPAFSKNTAFNKNFGVAIGDIIEIGASLGNSEILETNASGKSITATKGTAYNKAFGTSSDQVSEGDHGHTDLHSHSNKSILDLITAEGSGSIITTAERTKVTALPTYLLIASIPLFQEDLDAYIGGSSTGWVNTGVAQRIIDWSTIYGEAAHYNCNYLMSSTHATYLARFRLKNVTQAAYVTTFGHVISTKYNTISTPISAIGSGTKMIAGDTYEIWYYVGHADATGKLNSLVLNLYKELA